MNIVELNKPLLQVSYTIESCWIDMFNADEYCKIYSNGDVKYLSRNQLAWQNYKLHMIDGEVLNPICVTFCDEHKKYVHQVLGKTDLIRTWLNIEEDQFPVLFGNKEDKRTHLLTTPEGIFHKSFDLHVVFSLDGMTAILYQHIYSSNKKILILDNPVF